MRQIQLSSKGMRSEFKRIAEDFNAITKAYLANESSPVAPRQMQELVDCVIELQDGLNDVLEFVDEVRTHKATVVDLPQREAPSQDGSGVKEDNNVKPTKYYYYMQMQRISIIGFLTDDAKEFEKDGERRMRLSVIVETPVSADARKKNVYTVFAPKTGLFEHLKKGRQVFVDGECRFTFNRDKEKNIIQVDGEPSLNVVISADAITLCSGGER